MPTKTHTFTIDGNSKGLFDASPAVSFNVTGSPSIHRVRAKKSNSGGYFAFNVDAASSKDEKYPPYQDVIYDFNPESLLPDLADGDDITDIPNDVNGSKEATCASGSEAEFATSGGSISSKPAMVTGSSSKLTVASTYPSFGNGEAFTVALVIDEGGTTHRAAIGTDKTSNTYCTWYGNNGSRQVTIQDEAGNSLASSTKAYMTDNDIRVLRRNTSNAVIERHRGVERISGTLSGTIGFQTIGWVRQSSTVSTWNNLSLSRVLIFDAALEDDEIEDLEAWLAWYYGLQTSSNNYLPSTHIGYQNNVITSMTPAFSSDIDISSLGANTWSSYYGPTTGTISGDVDIYPTKAYDAGTVTIEVIVSY